MSCSRARRRSVSMRKRPSLAHSTYNLALKICNNLRERATLELQRARCTVSRQVCRNAMCASTGTRGGVWHALRLSVAVCCPGGAAHLEHPSASTPVSWTMRRIQRSSGSNARTCMHPMMLAAVPKALQALSACDSSFLPLHLRLPPRRGCPRGGFTNAHVTRISCSRKSVWLSSEIAACASSRDRYSTKA